MVAFERQRRAGTCESQKVPPSPRHWAMGTKVRGGNNNSFSKSTSLPSPTGTRRPATTRRGCWFTCKQNPKRPIAQDTSLSKLVKATSNLHHLLHLATARKSAAVSGVRAAVIHVFVSLWEKSVHERWSFLCETCAASGNSM